MPRHEFENGEEVMVYVPKSRQALEKHLKPFFTGKTVILSPFPESAWDRRKGTVVEAEVKPRNLKEKIYLVD